MANGKPVGGEGDAPETAIPRKINIILNWFEELKERVPWIEAVIPEFPF